MARQERKSGIRTLFGGNKTTTTAMYEKEEAFGE
jgi:hypothetical protein